MNSNLTVLLAVLASSGFFFGPSGSLVAGPPESELARESAIIDSLNIRALEFVERNEHPFYTGYIEYLRFQMMDCFKYREAEYGSFKERLEEWLEKAPNGEMPERPTFFEWAYLSKVDGSGQPITIQVPDSYSADTPSKLRVTMHGAMMTHAIPPDWKVNQNYVRVSVLGRARIGGYHHLSETDVLEAVGFMKEYWNIDPTGVYQSGGSMGGGGCFKLATRYPHLFTGAFVECGYGIDACMENALHIPFVSRHSVDDRSVVITSSRIPLYELKALGGSALIYEPDGFGHAIWEDTNLKDEHWTQVYTHERPAVVDGFSYTATDGAALRSYWAEIVKWGEHAGPATFDVNLDKGTLVIETRNIAVLKILMDESPLKDTKDLDLKINGAAIPFRRSQKSGDLFITLDAGKPVLSEALPEPKVRFHFPGGLNTLYKGEPILIVYGTTGDSAERDALRAAAEAASRSSSPVWLPDEHTRSTDILKLSDFHQERFLPLRAMYTANLPIKADFEVTDEDMMSRNLLLLGSPGTNSLVRRFSEKKDFPVTLENGYAITSDGMRYSLDQKALGLLWYNPEYTNRLVYFALSNDPSFYRPYSPLAGMQTWTGRVGLSRQASSDLIICEVDDGQIVCRRNFNADWELEYDYSDSGLVSDELCRRDEFDRFLLMATAADAEADFFVGVSANASNELCFTPGSTRWLDITSDPMPVYPLLYTYSGVEIVEIIEKLKEHNSKEDTEERISVLGRNGSSDISPQPNREYVMVVSSLDCEDYERAVMMDQPIARKHPKSFQEIIGETIAVKTDPS